MQDIFVLREKCNVDSEGNAILERKSYVPDILLLLTATIWGFAFVAQRIGMEHMGPFLFNGIRFALGAAVLLPFLLRGRSKRATGLRSALPGGLLTGLILFCGASLQQAGIVFTTAGKAGFITGLYVVIVPLMGIFWRQKVGIGTWTGVILAASGLYLLSVTGSLTVAPGDLLILAGAFFWALHVQVIGRCAGRLNPIALALVQFSVCALLSLMVALLFETIDLRAVADAALPILYSGILSVGVAYTLQVVAQRRAAPSHAAIIMSFETVAAALGGWIILHETMSGRGIVGCALMLSGMIISRLSRRRKS